MHAVAGDPPREGLLLQRFLALFLFAGAVFFGLGVMAAVVPALSGDLRALGMFAGTGLPAWALGWLGMVLWSGRRIPRWFLASFFCVVGALPLLLVVSCDSWLEALALVGMGIPSVLSYRSILRDYPGKPPKPKSFEEL